MLLATLTKRLQCPLPWRVKSRSQGFEFHCAAAVVNCSFTCQIQTNLRGFGVKMVGPRKISKRLKLMQFNADAGVRKSTVNQSAPILRNWAGARLCLINLEAAATQRFGWCC